ncbi:MAG: DNA repair protein RecO [Phycisphaeraceae bacterium]|nr:DNA repair protein RecO [Phycisphaeraceae bacterium]|tara:strand:- start:900 stop:1655 length:756 start_codon:yes stop_codon:yes gene_type:complete
MARFKEDAICIRYLDWSETSQIVVLLTREHGKLRGLAKGSKRTSPGALARYSGGIELLTLGQVVGLTKPTSELATITEWDLQDPYPHLRRDLSAQHLGLYGADLANALVADHDPHPTAFGALRQLLTELTEPSQYDKAILEFQWCMLDGSGYRPQLDRDVQTDEEIRDQQTYNFDARIGGLTNEAGLTTPDNGRGPWRVRQETVGLLRDLSAGRWQADQLVVRRASRLLCVYARAIIDRQLPTMKFVLDRG